MHGLLRLISVEVFVLELIFSVEYRVKGNEEWTKLDNSAITETGGTSYSAELTGLQSGTDYEVRALAGGSEGDV